MYQEGMAMLAEMHFERVLHSPERVFPPFVMLAGRSFLSDRVERMPEACFVPRRRRPEVTATLALDHTVQISNPPAGRLRTLRQRFSPVCDLPDGVLVDLRWIGLDSWFQGIALAPPYALMLQNELRAAGIGPVTFLIPKKMPGKLATLLRDILDHVVAVDGRVRGRFVSMTPCSRGLLDFLCSSWIAKHASTILDRVERVDRDFPRKVFLDRKTRTIANMKEISPHLAARGYETVFAEEFTAYEQIALLCRATHVAAIHGAALSPLVYRKPEDGPLRMVEIMSPGHVVPSFRNRVLGLNTTYFAVRGLPDARTARDIFDPTLRWQIYAQRHSRRSFRVDPLTIEIALDAEAETDLYGYVWEDR